jgi:hypothetical protein
MFLCDGGQEISPTALAFRAVRIVALFNRQFAQSLDKVPKIYTRGTPLCTYFTGETVPDGIAGNKIGIKKRFFNDCPGRLAKLNVTEKLGHRTTGRTLAALETIGKIALLDQFFNLILPDLYLRFHINTPEAVP